MLYKIIKGLVTITPPLDLTQIMLHEVTYADYMSLPLKLTVIYFLFCHLLLSSGTICYRM